MEKLIIGNWKMNKSLSEVSAYVKTIKKNAKTQKNLGFCVPSVMLTEMSRCAKNAFAVGAQNCHYAEKGAYTGEVSANMIKEAGASMVLVGHSERRHYFDESNQFIAKKVKEAQAVGLKVILCVGETLEEKPKFKSVIKKQVTESLADITDLKNIIIAYEPVWAIGTGKVATSADIVKAHSYIKQIVSEKFNASVSVLYGGSVNPKNSAEILSIAEVDGVLVGGASLNAEEFIKIAESRG